MEHDPLFNGYFYTQRAHDYFLRAHCLRDQPISREHYRKLAMNELEQLAAALGLELVERKQEAA